MIMASSLESSSVNRNGILVTLIKKSKWTMTAEVSGVQVASAKSKPKLFEKLDALYPKGEVEEIREPVVENEETKPKSIKYLVLDLIPQGYDDKFIITKVKKHFPESAFNSKHISWYRSTLHRDGVIGPEFAPRRSKAHKKWKLESKSPT